MSTIAGRFVLPNKIVNGTLRIENEKIAELKEGKPTAVDFDFGNKYILPGLIEVHGHLREPGMSQKEDIPHGTRAGVAGGFTTVIDMPNTNPPTTTVELLKEKMTTIYPGRSFMDYAFFLGVGKDSLGELEKVDPKDIVGVKLFMAGHETTPTTIPDDETLDKIMAILYKRNILLAVHAEDQTLINSLNDQFKKTGRIDPMLWSEIRPKEVVVNAVKRAINLAKKYKGFRLYCLHLSTPEEFDLVKEAQNRGDNVYGELVGYQLMFNITDYEKYGNKIKVAPALRTPEDQAKMWNLVKNSGVDVICSEHTPHEWETKNQPDMWKAQAGTPGLQETLPALITGWVRRFGKETMEQSLMRLANYCSKNPAEIFGFEAKGEIKEGKDADITVIDVNTTWEVKKEDLFSKCGWSSYEGMELIGRPIATFVRGNLVYKNGKVVGNPTGKMVL